MTRTRKRRIICGALAALMLAGMFTGCGKKQTSGEQVKLTIGGWPAPENNREQYDYYQNTLEKLKEKHPNVTVETDEYSYDIKQFLPRTASGLNPDLFFVSLTEPKKLISTGYIQDISRQVSERGYDKAIDEQFLNIVSKDGKIYGIPYNAYMMALICNVDLFKQAGLVDENGVPKYPQTYKELAETAKTIKEKTGQAGFVIPSTGTEGGWILMNIAWSNGVKFMEKDENGKWKATFNSPEMYETLQYISDLRWKYNALSDSVLYGMSESQKMFGTGQSAMIISSTEPDAFTTTYSMNKDKISGTILPAGSKDRCAQIGGAAYLMKDGVSDEQIKAALDWLEIMGYGAELSDEVLAGKETDIKNKVERGDVVTRPGLYVWKNKEYTDAINNLYDKYTNVDPKLWNIDQSKLKLRKEEPAAAQQLYEILSAAMQAVLTDKNTDIPAIVADAQSRFQKDYLDKLEF